MMNSTFGGIRIIESPFCLEETSVPRRRHVLSLAQQKSPNGQVYHDRIQKKWNKRFGFVMKPVMYEIEQGFLCHPSMAAELKKVLGDNETRGEAP